MKRRDFLVLLPLSYLFGCLSNDKNSTDRSSNSPESSRFSLTSANDYFAKSYLEYSGLSPEEVRKNFLIKFPNGFKESHLLPIIRKDYLNKKIVQLNGWVLSLTEAESCVYYQLQRAS
jgi:hypothetical protein